MLGCAIDGPSAAATGRLASRLFFRIELTEGKGRAPLSSARPQARPRPGAPPDPKRPAPGSREPVAAIALEQPDDADAGAEALLRVSTLAHDELDQGGGIASDLAGLPPDPLRRPIGITAMARRHVLAHRGMPPVG